MTRPDYVALAKERLMLWPVVPICGAQRRDVRPDDLIRDGLYRKCDVYRGGGGYDRFPAIASRRFPSFNGPTPADNFRHQFVVQLYGCPLRCPYCYITPAGYQGEPVMIDSGELLNDFFRSGLSVFHLMGGAPAIYIEQWMELIAHIPPFYAFTSDLLLTENDYDPEVIQELARAQHALFAVNIKGVTPLDYYRNTRTQLLQARFWRNFDIIVEKGLNFYLTFTNPDKVHLPSFKSELIDRYGYRVLQDSFTIDLVAYDALKG